MRFNKTEFEGLYLIELEPHADERGYLARSFCKEEFLKAGLKYEIVQASISFNKSRGTIRGMHFQKEPKAEDKIVQCLKGRIFDVAIDLRITSPTFRKWLSFELDGEKKGALFLPLGFAHGFQTLTDNVEVQYFMSEFYSPEHAWGVRWNDPAFNINWPLPVSVISEKDGNWPLVKPE